MLNIIKKELNGFDWKLLWIRTLATWGVLAVVLGIAVGLKAEAQEQEKIWMYVGSHDTAQFFVLRHSMTINSSGNPELVLKGLTKDDSYICQLEFDFSKGAVRIVKYGHSLDDMVKVNDDWMIPDEKSVRGILLKGVKIIMLR